MKKERKQSRLTGVGTSAPVIRSGGASRKSKAVDSQIWARISEPTPNATHVLSKSIDKNETRLTRETTLNGDQVLGLLHARDDSLNIQRPDTPKVDDLDLDTFLLLQQLGSLERVGDHLAVGDDGDVGTGLFNLGLADRDEEVLGEFFLGHGELDTVEELVLEETDLWTVD